MMPVVRENMNSTLAWIIFTGIFLLGFALRVVNLGGPDFGIDEILHVYAAKGLIEEGAPVLPSGTLYPRALVYTKLVAFVGEFWEINEWTARSPSVFWGLLTILLTFIIGRFWYSAGVGLVAAFLVAVIPAEIVFSRTVRMYTMFQFFYLAIIFLFFYGFESFGGSQRNGSASGEKTKLWDTLEIRPFVLVLAGLLFLFTLQIHVLVVPAMVGPLVYIFVMAAASYWLSQVSGGCKAKYVGSVLLIGIIALGVYVISDDFFERHLRFARSLPPWAQAENVENWRYYRDSLALRYPIVFGTFLFGGLLGLAKNPRLAIYLIICFAAPLLLSSFLVSWKAYRYIFHLLPVMFILFSIGFCELVSYLYRILVGFLEKELSRLNAVILAVGMLIVGTTFLLGSTQWFSQAIRLHQMTVGYDDGVWHNNWREATEFIASRAKGSDVIVTPWPILVNHYGASRKIYLLNNNNSPEKFKQYMIGPSIIRDLETLQKVIQQEPSGWIVSERRRFFNLPYSIPTDIRQWIEKTLTPEPLSTAEDMVLWRWERSS